MEKTEASENVPPLKEISSPAPDIPESKFIISTSETPTEGKIQLRPLGYEFKLLPPGSIKLPEE